MHTLTTELHAENLVDMYLNLYSGSTHISLIMHNMLTESPFAHKLKEISLDAS